MYDLYGKDVIRLCRGKLLNGTSDIVLKNFCIDTRKIQEGDVYVAIRGEKHDGHDFYQEAIAKGASSIVIDHVIEDAEYFDCTVILVEDTIKCLQNLARYKRGLYQIPVIAVTGSVGKTSTKDMIASVISQKYKTCKTMGNYNNHLGVPLTILSLTDEEVCVVEMGMNHLREIALLSDIAKPTISVITNIGTAHIGNLGSRENILKAKLEILEGMIGNDVVINIDDDMLCSVQEKLKGNYQVHTTSIIKASDYQAVDRKEDVFSSKFHLAYKDMEFVVNVGGKAFIYNALIAYAVGKILKIEDHLIRDGLMKFKLSSNRLERKVTSRGSILIDDTYNANYDSMKASVELLGRVQNARRIAILGDMLELGEYSRNLHEQLAEVIVKNHIDILVTIGQYSNYIHQRVQQLGMDVDNCYHFRSEKDSYFLLKDLLKEGDFVLIKGSHGLELVNIVNYLMSL